MEPDRSPITQFNIRDTASSPVTAISPVDLHETAKFSRAKIGRFDRDHYKCEGSSTLGIDDP